MDEYAKNEKSVKIENLLDEEKLEEQKKIIKENYCDRLKGLCAAFGTVVMMVVSAACVLLLGRNIPDFELNAVRYSEAFIFFAFWTIFTQQSLSVPKSKYLSTFVFCVLSFTNSTCIYVAVTFPSASSVESI